MHVQWLEQSPKCLDFCLKALVISPVGLILKPAENEYLFNYMYFIFPKSLSWGSMGIMNIIWNLTLRVF